MGDPTYHDFRTVPALGHCEEHAHHDTSNKGRFKSCRCHSFAQGVWKRLIETKGWRDLELCSPCPLCSVDCEIYYPDNKR